MVWKKRNSLIGSNDPRCGDQPKYLNRRRLGKIKLDKTQDTATDIYIRRT